MMNRPLGIGSVLAWPALYTRSLHKYGEQFLSCPVIGPKRHRCHMFAI